MNWRKYSWNVCVILRLVFSPLRQTCQILAVLKRTAFWLFDKCLHWSKGPHYSEGESIRTQNQEFLYPFCVYFQSQLHFVCQNKIDGLQCYVLVLEKQEFLASFIHSRLQWVLKNVSNLIAHLLKFFLFSLRRKFVAKGKFLTHANRFGSHGHLKLWTRAEIVDSKYMNTSVINWVTWSYL